MSDSTAQDAVSQPQPRVASLTERARLRAEQAEAERRASGPELLGRYEYRDGDGVFSYAIEVYSSGERRVLVPEHPAWPDGATRTLHGGVDALGNRLRPYGLQRLPDTAGEQIVWVAEDEQTADRLLALGAVALAAPGGFARWMPRWASFFAGHRVALLAADQETGRRAGAHLIDDAAEVRLARLPDAPTGADLASAWDAAQRIAGDVFATPFRPLPAISVSDLPPFPIEVLPVRVREQVEAVAASTATDPTMGAWFALGAASALLAPHVQTSAHNHATGLNLFTVVASPSGTAKSPVYSAMFAPVFARETQLRSEYEKHAAEAAAERSAVELEIKEYEAELKAAVKDAENPQRRAEAVKRLAEAKEVLAGLPEAYKPVLVHDDSTPEAVGRVLAEQGGALTIASSEGGLFDLLDGKMYSSLANLNPYLKGWSGDHLRIDRGGLRRARGAGEGDGTASVTVERPTLTVAIAVQPGVLHRIGARSIERGLMARFLFASVTARFGWREEDRPRIPQAVAEAYGALLHELAAAAAAAPGDVTLQLEPDARATYIAWRQTVERRTATGGDLGSDELRSWAEKAKEYAARVAGLLHLLHGGPAALTEPIPVQRVEDAARVLDAAAPHAAAVFGALGEDGAVVRARAIAEWIIGQGKAVFAAKDALLALRGRAAFETVDDIYAGLNVLEAHGWVRQHVEQTAGRPRTRWLVANEVHALGTEGT